MTKPDVCHSDGAERPKNLSRRSFTAFRMTMMLFLLVIVLLPTHTLLAQPTQVCKKADKCQIEEVGPFMVDISKDCGNTGDCTIDDIITVFNNVGNWILGVVGALVFLMYVWGGIQWLTSQGSPEKIGQGKKIIKTATIGLVIVFVANIAITTLEGTLRGSGGLGGATVPCTQDNEGQECGDNKICTNKGCASKCIAENGENWACIDTVSLSCYIGSIGNQYCQQGKCPKEKNRVGNDNICCPSDKIDKMNAECTVEANRVLPPPLISEKERSRIERP